MTSNWKARARAAVNRGDQRLLLQHLNDTQREAASVGSDLRLLLDTAGRTLNSDLEPTPEGLTEAERQYRAVAREGRVPVDDLRMMERLLALLLGETLIRSRGGQWTVYQGQFRTASPVVVRLNESGKHFDVAMLTHDLHRKRSLDGASDGCALAASIDKADSIAF